MARINNLTNFLMDVATAIKTKKGTTDPIPAENFDVEILSIFVPTLQSGKVVEPTTNKVTVNPDEGFDGFDSFTVNPVTSAIDENIVAENIAEGKTILGVEGTAKVLDTFDSTAKAYDLAEGKIAYANGQKITGTLPEQANNAQVITKNNISTITEDDAGIWVNGSVATDRIVRSANTSIVNIDKTQLANAIGLTADKIGRGNTILGVVGNLEVSGEYQNKTLEITKDGTYNITPDEGFDAMTSVIIDVAVASSMEIQHMPFYLLESDDAGYLWCVSNYTTMEYVPYSLDVDGNLIVNQDDTDTAVYWINENMELEVEVNG